MNVPSLEQQNGLSTRQIYVIAVSAAAQMIDFLDLFLIGFVLAYVAKPWHLTTTQSTIVLLSSGAGAALGSFVCGALSDRFGRRPVSWPPSCCSRWERQPWPSRPRVHGATSPSSASLSASA